jgi:uncharacterized protein YkwD
MRTVLVVITIALAALPGAAHAGSVTSAERLIRQCANHERLDAGLAPLAPAPALNVAARAFAQDMARRRFFDHTDPDGDGPQERVDLVEPGWLIGENIAAGYGSVRSACRGWMNSPGHRENILDPAYTVIGVGYARGSGGPYYVQDFGLPEFLDPEPPDPFELPGP